MLLDRGYVGRPSRKVLHQRRIRALIPDRSDQIRHRKRLGRKGGPPPYFNKEQYKRRNVVERCFNRLKQWRAIATRYDKLASHYQACLTIAMFMLWLNSHLSDTP